MKWTTSAQWLRCKPTLKIHQLAWSVVSKAADKSDKTTKVCQMHTAPFDGDERAIKVRQVEVALRVAVTTIGELVKGFSCSLTDTIQNHALFAFYWGWNTLVFSCMLSLACHPFTVALELWQIRSNMNESFVCISGNIPTQKLYGLCNEMADDAKGSATGVQDW